MTPNAIEILIHCYVSPAPHPRIHAGSVEQELRSFVTCGLVEAVEGKPGCYTATPRGVAHIKQLCALPWPTEAWVGADGKVIES